MRRVLGIVVFNFVGYCCVGLPLAVVPGFVHGALGYGTVLAGLAVSLQYVATLLSRTMAGRLCDHRGPKVSLLVGLLACALSGACTLGAALAGAWPLASLSILFVGRLLLGCGESLVTTATILWGIGAVGGLHTGRVISWNGVTTYGALAVSAPVGVFLAARFGLASLGVATLLMTLVALVGVAVRRGVPPIHGERIPARQVLRRMLPFGLCLGLGSVGFGAITAFIALYYADHGWPHAALAVTLLGVAFVTTRLILPNAINRHGGYRVAVVSLGVEALGLVCIWLAPSPLWAACGAGITGAGFALVFPALGMEAVKRVSDSNRGTALGIYSLFLDLALAITGPAAGALAVVWSYGAIYLVAGFAALGAAAASLFLARRAYALA
ncbi:MFS transporter [Pseudoxanthomonas sp. JBR18]|uniref:MFS transporter n=1 Tax=Pseudoxanthomonas sp. JBR18 TaxID=2969308 RepID=UPI002305E070|nr:MFS transporter [Pseudoxanthomonas sp. JBR18]WCE06099.1 MFS transporter [Pseudoxanthomonas sp. JBR18]